MRNRLAAFLNVLALLILFYSAAPCRVRCAPASCAAASVPPCHQHSPTPAPEQKPCSQRISLPDADRIVSASQTPDLTPVIATSFNSVHVYQSVPSVRFVVDTQRLTRPFPPPVTINILRV